MTKLEEAKYHKKLKAALLEYTSLCDAGVKPNAPELIKKHGLIKWGEYITSKRFYNVIYKSKEIQSWTQRRRTRNTLIVGNLKKGNSNKSVCEKHNISKEELRRIRLAAGLQPRTKQTKKLTPKIIQRYIDGVTIEQISRELGLCNRTISSVLQEKGIQIRYQDQTSIRYPNLKVDYFQNIDTPQKAWVLGFIFADGSISGMTNLSVSQSIENRVVLDILKEELCHTGKLTIAKKSHTDKLQGVASFSRKEICQQLKQLGLTENKENDLGFPFDKIRKEFYWAFLSGFYNGDGGLRLGIKRNTRVKSKTPGWVITLGWQITSTKAMCEDIKNFLSKELKSIRPDVRREGEKNAFRISIVSSGKHILQVVQKLDQAGFGIMIPDKYDKAVFYQRHIRKTHALKLLQIYPEANLFHQQLVKLVKKEENIGRSRQEIANFYNLRYHGLNRYLRSPETIPRTERLIRLFENTLKIDSEQFIDWEYLASRASLPDPWNLKLPSYAYHGYKISEKGRVKKQTSN